MLHFFDLEACCDRLQLKQMVSGMNYVVAEFRGTERTSRQYTSAENRFTLSFTSDGSVVRRGFRASYYAIESGGKCLQFIENPGVRPIWLTHPVA